MGIINQLDYATANLVAAGEVIERPASIVKELIENSIDAGATRITLEIKRGGITFIRVTDNGKGMAREDVPISILRHATSKIKTGADLDAIMTLGFRGEALASVAAVATLRIRTKQAADEMGTELYSEPGKEPVITEAGMSDGTTIIVEELFASIPARRKFLKKDLTETNAVQAVFEKIALSSPHIAMTLIIDGSRRIQTVGDGKLMNAIWGVMGADFASKLIELRPAGDIFEGMTPLGASIKVGGYIGTPENIRSNRNFQCFFVNGRFVRSRCLQAAMEQAFASYIPQEKYPSCVMFVDLDASDVDVNVHPTKLEVKFAQEKAVFEAVYFAVRGALESRIPRPSFTLDKSERKNPLNAFVPIEDRSEAAPKPVYNNQRIVKRGQLSVLDAPQEAPPEPPEPEPVPPPEFAPPSETVYEAIPVRSPEDIPKKHIQTNFWESIPPELDDKLKARHDGVIGRSQPQQMTLGELPDVIAALEPHPSPKQIAAKRAADPTIPHDAPPSKAPAAKSAASPATAPQEQTAQEQTAPEKKPPKEFRIIGEAFLSYVFVEVDDRVMIIDKHAAHERILFEDLRANRDLSHVPTQMLLLPIEVSLSPEETAAVEDYAADVRALGFEFVIQPRGVSVSAIPVGIEADAVADMMVTIGGQLAGGTGVAAISRDILFDRALYQAACKAAIKAGRDEDIAHIKWIVGKLLSLDDIKVCPHGRPVAFDLSKAQIERQFKRS